MDRRKALKNMGFSLGYTVATPTLINLMQSCKSEASMKWVPDFFSQEEGNALVLLVDLILPASDTPSASEVQVPLFIDRFAAEVMTSEQQAFWKTATNVFLEDAYSAAGKDKSDELTAEDLEPILASSLKFTEKEKEDYDTLIENYMVKMAEGEKVSLNDKAAKYAFATNLRGITIWGYKTSQYVGERVLKYLPVPGGYVACGDLDELTGGKAWSPNR